ncbi:putative hydrolase [Arcanobacterium pluranimalium]|uniref:zinc-dependent metalloprotease n=1 Tax=Arcanobacterium pluranimalium TaxID=108028 RepID=UPI0019581307|nr:zinc-dependent metalloprotease [Arcanobacterium pluranimalium]MBM7825807.1 putative hydrolase [Arcanobacterium pluranimalium]
MSQDPNEAQDPNNFEQMLRAILGDEAAQEVVRAFEQEGVDPNAQMSQMFNGQDFTVISQQIQDLLGSSGDGAVNWKIAEQVARETIAAKHLDQLTSAEGDAARNALRTASLWLDAACELDPTVGPNMAWMRLDWVAHSLPTFKRLFDPVGENIVRAVSESFEVQVEHMPPEMQGMFGDPTQIMGKVLASMLGVQYGAALAELATASFGTTDTGLPLMEGSSAALVPSNILSFAQELDIEYSEVLAYVAVREAAAARLYTRVPWLRSRVLDTVAEFAQGITINTEAIEEQLRDISMEDPSAMHEIDLSGVFSLDLTDSQADALSRLEHLISLVEGWVSEISARAVAPHLPHAVPLREMFTRRSATNNPAKHVWETQLGMQLVPRQIRDAAKFWQLAFTKLGAEERDALWSHPDLLPTSQVLSNPEEFFTEQTSSDIEAELDSFLADLFSESNGSAQGGSDIPHEPKFGESETDK